MREAVDDWLREGLGGTSDRTRTLYEGLLGPVLDAIGARPLRQHMEQQERDRLSAGELWQEHGLVFSSRGQRSVHT